MEKKEKKSYNYTEEVQQLLLNFMLSDASAFSRCQTIINEDHWASKLKPAVRYVLDFANEYNALPTIAQVTAETGVPVENVPDIQPQHSQWFLDTIEEFTRHKAIELVVYDGADMVTDGNYGEMERRLKEAMTISLQTDLGTDYFADPKARIQEVLDRQDVVSTGWEVMDKKLYGGFSKGTLNIFAGGSGSGKSLFLQNLALNWAFAGFNVVYFSLELSENLVSARLDSMVSGMSYKDVFRKIDDVDLKVRMAGKKAGNLKVKKLPEAGTTANDLRAYLKEYEIQTGIKPQAVLVDYLDLMYPNNRKINPSDMFVKDKFVSEELRALSSEYHLLFATASQLNRASVEAQEFDHSHIAGGISKINTADNVFGIFTSQSMRERGEYQLQMLKTRSSSAVGQKLSLKYDVTSLRIMDPDPDEELTQTRDLQSIGQQIKQQVGSTVAPQKPRDAIANTTVAKSNTDAPPTATPSRTNMMDLLAKVQRK